MAWVIKTGPNGVIGVASALDIVVGRLAYMQREPHANRERLIAEALDYARHVQRWVTANEPPPPPRVPNLDRHGKPGPMSDG
jgi:hypothetical protein